MPAGEAKDSNVVSSWEKLPCHRLPKEAAADPELLDYMRTRKADLMQTIREKGTLPEGDALQSALEEFVRGFQPTVAAEAVANVTATDAASAGPETSPETLETE